MVNAELIHNPYLLETTARFNGREPKVNSAIEKFERRPLVDWVDEVPRTLRDEMNGLDFDLYFTGTKSDYERLIKAFTEQGIDVYDESSDDDQLTSAKTLSEYDVRMTHTGGFESVSAKRQEIASFIEWLKEHRNRWFDFDEFINQNSESLDELVPYIVVNKGTLQTEIPFVSIETVDSAQNDLAGTVLTNTPVLFMVDAKNKDRFRNELLYVKDRRDVEHRQLFFCIHPSMDQDRVIRVISDLGVEDPQVVDKPDSPRVLQYIDDYPSMDYVREAIEVFRSVYDTIRGILDDLNAETIKTSQSRVEEMAALDQEIEYHKRARTLIGETKSFGKQGKVYVLYQEFENRILTWRNRKTGATGHDEIQRAAKEFVFDIRGWVRTFDADIITTMQDEQNRIERAISGLYYSAGDVPDFEPDVPPPSYQTNKNLPNLTDALMSQTGTEMVNPKNDFFGFFGGGKAEGPAEKVEIASYDVWRFTARGMLSPGIQRMVKACEQELAKYHASLVEAYTQQLDALIEQLLEDKELVTAMLSDEERLLEEDKDWLAEFEKHLLAIERN